MFMCFWVPAWDDKACFNFAWRSAAATGISEPAQTWITQEVPLKWVTLGQRLKPWALSTQRAGLLMRQTSAGSSGVVVALHRPSDVETRSDSAALRPPWPVTSEEWTSPLTKTEAFCVGQRENICWAEDREARDYLSGVHHVLYLAFQIVWWEHTERLNFEFAYFWWIFVQKGRLFLKYFKKQMKMFWTLKTDYFAPFCFSLLRLVFD